MKKGHNWEDEPKSHPKSLQNMCYPLKSLERLLKSYDGTCKHSRSFSDKRFDVTFLVSLSWCMFCNVSL